MRHINTRQVDNHCWTLEVTDGYNIKLTGKLDGSRLKLYAGESRGRHIASATINEKTESGTIGQAMALMFNWDQQGLCANEPMDPRWEVTDNIYSPA